MMAPQFLRNSGQSFIVLLVRVLALAGLTGLLGCAPDPEPEPGPPNFLLITLDTTRPDHLGPYGYARAHTPNLARFAERALVYERAYASSSWTLASHASIFTGLLPGQHGAQSVPTGPDRSLGYGVRPLSSSFRTLAEILSEAGYQTGAVIAGPAMRSELGLAQGFDTYEDDLEGRERRTNGKRAAETTDLALALLDRFDDSPFFLFVNYFDPHAPYQPPADFEIPSSLAVEAGEEPNAADDFSLVRTYIERLNAGVEPKSIGASPPEELVELHKNLLGYDAEIAYMDQHLGRLLAAIEALPDAENTWVIITGDHGESFGEHYFVSHGAHLYEDNVRVPLLVRAARTDGPGRFQQPVQNHGIFASVLAAAGLTPPDWALPLPSEGSEREIVLEVRRSDSNVKIGGAFFDRDLIALLDAPFKLIRSSRDGIELFDLSSDPEELVNLRTARPEIAAEMNQRLSIHQSEHPPLYGSSEGAELREDTIEALRAMGYIE